MSVQAMTWAMKQEIVTAPTPRHVLLCLANYAGEDGVGAFPSVSRLARDTGMDERTVQRNLAKLEEAGLIVRGNPALAAARIDRGDRRPNVWNLAMEADAERGGTESPRRVNGVAAVQNGVALVRERGGTAPPDPSINHQEEQDQKRAPKVPTPAELFPDVDPAHLRDWLVARKAKRLPLTETAAKGFRRAAAEAGMTAAEAVRYCAERGWAGLRSDYKLPPAHAGPAPQQTAGKQMQGIMALEALKRGNRMADGRGGDGLAEARLLVPGSNPSG